MTPTEGRQVSASTAARWANVSRSTIIRWIHEGKLPDGIGFKIVGRWRIWSNKFKAWLKEQEAHSN